MTEVDLACARLADDLVAAGAGAAAAAIARAYRRALEDPSDAAWRAFYVRTFAALAAIVTVPADGRRAYARLAALADDDLGIEILAAADREAVRGRLVEAA